MCRNRSISTYQFASIALCASGSFLAFAALQFQSSKFQSSNVPIFKTRTRNPHQYQQGERKTFMIETNTTGRRGPQPCSNLCRPSQRSATKILHTRERPQDPSLRITPPTTAAASVRIQTLQSLEPTIIRSPRIRKSCSRVT
jgi:hypothetical protein